MFFKSVIISYNISKGGLYFRQGCPCKNLARGKLRPHYFSIKTIHTFLLLILILILMLILITRVSLKCLLQCLGDQTVWLSQCFPFRSQTVSMWMTIIMRHLCEWPAEINPCSYKTKCKKMKWKLTLFTDNKCKEVSSSWEYIQFGVTCGILQNAHLKWPSSPNWQQIMGNYLFWLTPHRS